VDEDADAEVLLESSSQGVESSWAAIVSSMLASPPKSMCQYMLIIMIRQDSHGASEQYM
jgi:hypothetical protein